MLTVIINVFHGYRMGNTGALLSALPPWVHYGQICLSRLSQPPLLSLLHGTVLADKIRLSLSLSLFSMGTVGQIQLSLSFSSLPRYLSLSPPLISLTLSLPLSSLPPLGKYGTDTALSLSLSLSLSCASEGRISASSWLL